MSVRDNSPSHNSIQGLLDSIRAAGVKDDEPFARVADALAVFARVQNETIEIFREDLKQSLPIDRIEAKRQLLTVMIESKGEFLRYLAGEYQAVVVISLVVIAALFFVLGCFVGANW